MSSIKDLLGPMRLPFIILTPACVVLGLGAAVWKTTAVQINGFHVVLLFLGAISAHISVNAFNEYFDFKSGLDFKTNRTPFSGGSGTLPENPGLAGQALATAIATFSITLFLGIYFVTVSGLLLIPLGLLGLFIIYTYTPWLTRNAVLCLITPGVGFGTLMVMGTYFVAAGEYSWTAFVASLIPFFLVSNLLLLNQFPDVEADRTIERKHFPITVGKQASSTIYISFLFLTYLTIVGGVYLELMPKLCLIGLLTIGMAVPAGIGAYRHADNTEKLIPSMGLNVVINIATPTLVAIGFFF
ncbi:MAG: prenyltransferase [Desulfobacterales bacterium]